MNTPQRGFTLIEVLLALMIIAIGMTALLKTTALNIQTSSRLKEKAIQHIVGMNAIAEIQSNLLNTNLNHETTQVTTMFGQTWYWRAKMTQLPIKSLQQITVSVSHHQAGPFTNSLIGYRYSP